jgi:hypothetical protein
MPVKNRIEQLPLILELIWLPLGWLRKTFPPLWHGTTRPETARWAAENVISEKAIFIGRRRDFQSIAILLAQAPTRMIQMIKNAETGG